MKEFFVDKLRVASFQTRAEMGAFAAKECADAIKQALREKDEINMIFAAAPSQNEFLAALVADEEIDFTRINAFHMDEYVGLAPTAPQGFGNFLKAAIFSKAPFKSVNYISPEGDPESTCAAYAELLAKNPVDIVCMGIGENGHIAFNDPHVAFFNDEKAVKVVELDLKCRNQQVNDGCFKSLDEVPTHAITLTIPSLFKGKKLFCVVPARTKAEAVKTTVMGEITEKCPASILRRHDCATLYIDADSASLLAE